MNFYTKKPVNNFHIGDLVKIVNISARSMNLYEKVLTRGLTNTKCPCNTKAYDVLEIIQPLSDGFYLRNKNTNKYTVAVNQDLQKVL